MVGYYGHTPDKEIFIYNLPIKLCCCRYQLSGGGSKFSQIYGAVGMLGNLPAIAVYDHFPMIGGTSPRIQKVFNIIAHCYHQLIRCQPLFHQVKAQAVCHFLNDNPRLGSIIGTLQHLAVADAIAARLIGLYIRNTARLPAPGMVNEQLRIFAKKPIKQILILL